MAGVNCCIIKVLSVDSVGQPHINSFFHFVLFLIKLGLKICAPDRVSKGWVKGYGSLDPVLTCVWAQTS